MNPLEIIGKCYKKDSGLYNILVNHSTDVTRKALAVAKKHPELELDVNFIEEAAMIHDIGIFLTHAPSIKCHGSYDYMCHGYLGREIMESLGYPKHALVCERHTGTGLSVKQIIAQNLPLPHRDMQPISLEEQVICFADCFYSKTKLGEERSLEKVRKGIASHGVESLKRLDEWCEIFL